MHFVYTCYLCYIAIHSSHTSVGAECWSRLIPRVPRVHLPPPGILNRPPCAYPNRVIPLKNNLKSLISCQNTVSCSWTERVQRTANSGHQCINCCLPRVIRRLSGLQICLGSRLRLAHLSQQILTCLCMLHSANIAFKRRTWIKYVHHQHV